MNESTDLPPAVGGAELGKLLHDKHQKKISEDRKRINRENRIRNKEKKIQTKKNDGRVGKKSNSGEEETCNECGGIDGDIDDWIGCDCGKWFHKWCISDLNVLNMREEALQEYIFKCDNCRDDSES